MKAELERSLEKLWMAMNQKCISKYPLEQKKWLLFMLKHQPCVNILLLFADVLLLNLLLILEKSVWIE